MTQEEKAKAYDKALEKIKYVIEHGVSPTLNKEDLENIFPELAESEDEMIRQAMINFFKSERIKDGIAVLHFGVNIEKMIAWLEKQGEQKDKIFDFKSNDWYVSKVDGKIHNMTYNPNNKVEHPKWTEEDERMMKSCIGAIHIAGCHVTNSYTAKDKEEMKQWLKSLKQRMEE